LGQIGETPRGTIVAFATAPGRVAADGSGRNSPFTTALVSAIGKVGLDIDQIFKETGRAVIEATKEEQQPWINSSFFGSFVLKPGTVAADGTEVKQTTGHTEKISPEASFEPNFLNAGDELNSKAAPVDQSLAGAPSGPPVASKDYPNATFPSLSDIFDGTGYDYYNTYSKRKILKLAQENLKNAGFYELEPDGSVGPATHSALLAAQRERGLPLSGRLDSPTLDLLNLQGISESNPPAEKPASASKNASSKTKKPAPPASSATKTARYKAVSGQSGVMIFDTLTGQPVGNSVYDMKSPSSKK
jgi:hypothetical protein